MNRRRTFSLLSGLVAAAVFVRGGGGCGGGESSPAMPEAGVDAAVVDVRVDRELPPEDAAHGSAIEGWQHYADYDPACEFYIPESRAHMPPPIRWEPCRPNAETSTKSCRQMVLDWAPQKAVEPELISPGTKAMRRADGHISLLSARYEESGTIRFVADVDGDVLVAVRQQKSSRCVLNGALSDGEYYAFQVLDSEAKGALSEYGGGVIGGRLDVIRPKVLEHLHDAVPHAYVAGGPGLLTVSGGMKLLSWNDGAVLKTFSSPPEDVGLSRSYQFFHADALFWAASGGVNKQKVHTDAGGTTDIVSFGNDFSNGAADLGTDGQNLVWMEGYNRTTTSGIYPSIAAVVSPYTTNPTQIQKRVLRTDLSAYPFGTSPFVVGCGYAARTNERVVDGQNRAGLLLLRLSDGGLWFLPSGSNVEWGWSRPLAITCDEIFVKVTEKPTPTAKPRSNVARVRLDSLGPPLPP